MSGRKWEGTLKVKEPMSKAKKCPMIRVSASSKKGILCGLFLGCKTSLERWVGVELLMSSTLKAGLHR